MPLTLLISVALVGPPVELSAEHWLQEYRSVLEVTAERRQLDPEIAVPRLTSLYVSLANMHSLERSERQKMQVVLRRRLITQLDQLMREKRRHEAAQVRRPTLLGHHETQPGGGPVGFAAQSLIDLIISTIAPDSWKQDGGRGSISYYPRNPALIIRQTGEVHGDTADLLRALRR